MPDDLPEQVRALLQELRNLKESSGRDLRALERHTHASRSSWGRWLTGETWIPANAVDALAELCGGDRQRLRKLWEQADYARRQPSHATPQPVAQPVGQSVGQSVAQPAGHPLPVQDVRPAAAAELAVPAAPVAPVAGVTVPPPATWAGNSGAEHIPVTGYTAGYGTAVPHAPAPPGVAGQGDQPKPGRHERTPNVRGWRRLLPPSAALGVAAGLTLGIVAGEFIYDDDSGSAQVPAQAPPIARSQALIRAQSWQPGTPQRIPYSQAKDYGGYRSDGSGYASMILGLPKPGPNSSGLASQTYSRRIAMSQLLPGDMVIDSTGDEDGRFVLIFDRWVDKKRTSYYAYQQRRGYGTDHRAVAHGLGGQDEDEFRAYRPVNIR